MKLQLPQKYWKNRGPPPLILYKSDPTIVKTLIDKSNSLKVDIKTQPGERDIETVAIYVQFFWAGSPESLLKFLLLLHKIIWGHDLSKGPQRFWITRNLVVR